MTIKDKSINVGVDVGKDVVDVYVWERRLALQAANEPKAIRKLVTRLARYPLARIVVEATGRYERLRRKWWKRPSISNCPSSSLTPSTYAATPAPSASWLKPMPIVGIDSRRSGIYRGVLQLKTDTHRLR